MNLIDLLRQPEGKTLEFKRNLTSPDGILRSLVAFANTSGGTLLVGIEDKTHQVVGVRDPLDMEERLANLISDRIQPSLVPDIEILPWRRIQVLAVRIHPSSVRPHFLLKHGPDKGVYIRVGSTNRRADAALIAELKRYTLQRTFDEEPLPDLDSEAIDFMAASESFKSIRPLKKAELESLGIMTRHQGQLVPTVGGVILFGRERVRHFPDAWVQAGRFHGIDRSRILDSVEITDNLSMAVEESILFIQRSIARELIIDGTRRVEKWTYPLTAIREAVINAIVHADYSQSGAPIRIAVYENRLEIENPGLLPFGLTIDDIQRGVSKLRNRVIGRVFRELGYIEQWGSGIQRMMRSCQESGLALPLFEEIGTHFRVTLSADRIKEPELDQLDQAVIDLLAEGEGFSTSQFADRLGRSSRAMRTRLLRLVEQVFQHKIGIYQ